MNGVKAFDGNPDKSIRTFLIAHAGNRARHVLETALSLADGRLHIAHVPDLEQSTRHGNNQSVSN